MKSTLVFSLDKKNWALSIWKKKENHILFVHSEGNSHDFLIKILSNKSKIWVLKARIPFKFPKLMTHLLRESRNLLIPKLDLSPWRCPSSCSSWSVPGDFFLLPRRVDSNSSYFGNKKGFFPVFVKYFTTPGLLHWNSCIMRRPLAQRNR